MSAPEHAAWGAVLDGLAATLGRAEGLLATGDAEAAADELGTWSPPAGLGPLDPAHRDRAEGLLAALADLTGTLAQAQAQLGTALSRLAPRGRPRPDPAPPRFVDQRA